MKTKSLVWAGYSQIHHGQSKYRGLTLMCTSEGLLQYVADQNIHVARHLHILSRDKTTDLSYDFICHMTLL